MARSAALVLGVLLAAGCSLPRHTGSSQIEGSVPGVSLATSNGGAIAYAHGSRIRIGTTDLTCETTLASDHLSIDLATVDVGTYHLVPGYPTLSSIGGVEARAHACTADINAPCHDLVKSGTVTITYADVSVGGRLDGTFVISFADGDVSGSFSALVCGDGATGN